MPESKVHWDVLGCLSRHLRAHHVNQSCAVDLARLTMLIEKLASTVAIDSDVRVKTYNLAAPELLDAIARGVR